MTWDQSVDEIDVVAREGEKLRAIVRTLSPASISPPVTTPPGVSRPVPWTALGFGVGAVLSFGSFAFFGIRGASDSDALHAGCAPVCSSSAENGVRNQLIVADVSLALGIAASAVALWSYVGSRGASARPTSR